MWLPQVFRVLLATGFEMQAARGQQISVQAHHIVVPYAAGGSTDQLARAIQQPMADYLKQPVIVENKAGARVVPSAPNWL